MTRPPHSDGSSGRPTPPSSAAPSGAAPSGATSPSGSAVAGPHVVLLGMMGSGKTTLGRLLAERLGRSFLDNDAGLFARTGRTPGQLAAERGSEGLHAAEAEVLRAALASQPPAVIAVHGGAVLDPGLREALRPTFRVWLDASPEALATRIASPGQRPLLARDLAAALRTLDAERRPYLAQLAELVLSTDAPDFTLEGAVDRVARELAARG